MEWQILLLWAAAFLDVGPQHAYSALIDPAHNRAGRTLPLDRHSTTQARAPWLSLFDPHVLPRTLPSNSHRAGEGGAWPTADGGGGGDVRNRRKYMLVVGGMQNLGDYQGPEPLLVCVRFLVHTFVLHVSTYVCVHVWARVRGWT